MYVCMYACMHACMYGGGVTLRLCIFLLLRPVRPHAPIECLFLVWEVPGKLVQSPFTARRPTRTERRYYVDFLWKVDLLKYIITRGRGARCLIIKEAAPQTKVDTVCKPQLLDNKVSGPSGI